MEKGRAEGTEIWKRNELINRGRKELWIKGEGKSERRGKRIKKEKRREEQRYEEG